MKNTIEKKVIQPQGFSRPLGAYSHAVSAKPGRLLFIAGQVAVDGNQIIGQNDFGAQMEQVFKNIGAILESAGASFENIVEYTTFMVREEDLPLFYEKRKEIFSRIHGDGVYPPNTLLVITRLAREELLLEIKAIAALP